MQPSSPTLSAADHEHFLEHGYVVVKAVADPAAVAEALAEFAVGRYSGTVGAADYRPVMPAGLSRCYGPRFAAALGELFGEPHAVSPSFAGMDMPRPHEPEKAEAWTFAGAHTDDDYPTPMPAGWAIGCFLFLTPVRPRGGAFVYYAGSYHRYLARMAESPWTHKIDAVDPRYSGPPAEFLAEAGDLLLFHHLCGHSGSTNVTDPATRHALLSRHHPARRIVPGDKDFANMSTIEKAYSKRYLRQRFGREFTVAAPVPGPAGAPGLEAGFAGHSGAGALLTAAPLHAAGRVWLAYTQETAPTTVRLVSSADWSDWRDEASLDTGAPVGELTLFQRQPTVYLLAGGQAFASDDLRHWRAAPAPSGAAAIAGHYTTAYGSRTAQGYVAITRRAGEQELRAGWAPTFEAALTAGQGAIAHTAPAGSRLLGFATGPTLGEGEFALVLDLDVDGRRGPWVARGRDAIVFAEPAISLPHDAPATPRHLRIYHSARNFWLVTYLRPTASGDHLFWGAIEWTATPALRELRTAADLRDALSIVGVI